MKVLTKSVRNQLVGDARKALKNAAGANQLLSTTEAKKLPKDVASAAEAVRAKKGSVSVNDAVDAYASKVTKVLTAVDTRSKGVLSDAEAKRIRDPELRASVLAARARLLQGDGGVTPGAVKTSAALVTAMGSAMSGIDGFCESGDHGVNVTIRKVPGSTLAEVMKKVHLDPAAPWTHAETNLELWSAGTVANAVDTFNATAKEALELERTDMPDVVESFTNGVRAQFGALTDVRLVSGRTLGGTYLIGKSADGYVAVVVQPYHD